MKTILGICLVLGFVNGAVAQPKVQPAPLPRLEVEELENTAVYGTRTGRYFLAPNKDGSADLLQFYYPDYKGRADLLIADLGTGETKWEKFVPGQERLIFHLPSAVLAPNRKLFICGHVVVRNEGLQHRVSVYDPDTNTLDVDSIRTPTLTGEVGAIALAPDGKVHIAGMHPNGGVTTAEIDPDTYQVTDYGALEETDGKKKREGAVYSMAVDGRYTYIVKGKLPWCLVVYDREEKKAKTLITLKDVPGAYALKVYKKGGKILLLATDSKNERKSYLLKGGEMVDLADQADEVPQDTKVVAGKAYNFPDIATVDVIPDGAGRAALWWRPKDGEKSARPPKEYAEMEAQGWKAIRYEVPRYPTRLVRIHALEDGRIMVIGEHFNNSLLYDTKSGAITPLGAISLSVYAVAGHGGKLYFSGYPGAPVWEYDPGMPWTAGTRGENGYRIKESDREGNPRMVGLLKDSAAHKMYRAAVGSDGKVYFGGRRMRNGSIGGFGWYDPKTETLGGFWEEISNYQITHVCAAGDDIVISTRRVDDPVLGKPKPEQGALLFYNVKEGKITDRFEPFPKLRGPGPIVYHPSGLIIGYTQDPENPKGSLLYAIRYPEKQVVATRKIAVPLPFEIGSNQLEAWDFVLGPDRNVWTFIKDTLVKISPDTLEYEVVTRLKQNEIGPMAFVGNDLYIAGGLTLKKISNIIAAN